MRKFLAAAAAVLLIALDQLTKYLAAHGILDHIVLIPGVFELLYVENQGAAFGILQQKTVFFILFTLLMMILLVIFYVRIPNERGYGWIRFSLILIFSGACGNLLDRVFQGYVVDFLYFSLIDFPVFNVADSYVVCGVILFILLYLCQREKIDRLFEQKKAHEYEEETDSGQK